MSDRNDNLYTRLKRIFHEPNRLAIMSALSGSPNGLTFNDLKKECSLTDGNLNRHLKVLEEADAIHIKKTQVGAKSRTVVFLTDNGRLSFLEYLEALEEVLKKAAESVGIEEEKAEPAFRVIKEAVEV